jgi:xanthine dehydrogenase accessory factor
MWVDDQGAILGAVTIGGCVDARVIEEASKVLESGTRSVLTMSLGDEDAWALGMTCAGTITVLVEPSDPRMPDDPVSASERRARDEVARGGRAMIVASLEGSPGRLVVLPTGETFGSLGDAEQDRAAAVVARERLGAGAISGVDRVVWGSSDERHYFGLHAPPLSLVVFGATHVAIPLIAIGRTLGFHTVVVDGRDRFATRARFPDVDELLVGMPSEIAEQLRLGPSSVVVLLSHDYKYDLPVLRAVLASDAGYVGCLGSVRRGRALLEFLAEEGITPAQLARVRIPVGLDIGARSASEIALSVLAEAMAVMRGRDGRPMRERDRGGSAQPS